MDNATIYYLSTCDTCRRILGTLEPPEGTRMQDIKTRPLSPSEVDALRSLAGSYEALVNKRARLYGERGIAASLPDEARFRELLLDHYTFLKRPVVVRGREIFIGNAAKTVAAAKEALHR